MKLIYHAIFHKENNSIWVEFSDLEGCQSYGDNISEASDIQLIKNDENSFTTLVETDLTA